VSIRYLIIAAVVAAAVIVGPTCLAGDTVRVLVVDDMKGIEINFPGPYEVRDDSGMDVVKKDPAGGGFDIVLDENTPGNGIRLMADGFMIRVNEYSLTGMIEVTRNEKGLFRLVNELDIEDYVSGVVGLEMSPSWSLEALKAQAVAARTYVLYRKRIEACNDYDLCGTVNSQMFKGDAFKKDGPLRAAKETEGLVLYYKGRPAEAVYHGSCGGTTEDAFAVWDNDSPYLVSRACGCRIQSPYASWKKTYTAGEIERALVRSGYKLSGIRSVSVLKKSGSGRAAVVGIETSSGTLKISGNNFRKAIGYTRIPSTGFEISGTNNGYIFTGRGSGHGVGMCQWGAKVMSDKGVGFRRILSHYYPNAEIVDIRAVSSL
jgi:stage II sporulation protein D